MLLLLLKCSQICPQNISYESIYVDRATSPVNLSNTLCIVVDQMPRSTGDAESTRCKQPAGPPKPGITTVLNLKRLQVLQNRGGGTHGASCNQLKGWESSATSWPKWSHERFAVEVNWLRFLSYGKMIFMQLICCMIAIYNYYTLC